MALIFGALFLANTWALLCSEFHGMPISFSWLGDSQGPYRSLDIYF
jgi:hypothetical protein